ncbi:MAG: glycosyltransferase N-terminal domain-containing protein [Planctomycetota bacterium]
MGLGRDIVYGIGAVATSPIWGLSLLRTGKWRTDWAGRFGDTAGRGLGEKRDGVKRLLIHGVSVGEVNLIRNLVAELNAVDAVEVVVATTTNTGFARASALYGKDSGGHAVVRFPFDFSGGVKKFLDAVRPDAVALVELEVWPNFVEACNRRGVPVAVVNGRLTERSYRGYRRLGPLIRGAFRGLTVAGVQTEDYAERFVGVGVPAERVKVLDTMKWDTAVVEDTVDGAGALAEAMGIDRGRPLVVAGSTAPGEERLLIEAAPRDAQLLIAPRKPEWFEGVVRMAKELGRGVVRRTAPDSTTVDTDNPPVFLLDTIGELRAAYSLADVCVVGRSFTGELYGSDMMEPIALGKPTVIGPYYADFAETMRALEDAGGIVVTDDPASAIDELLRNRTMASEVAAAGREVIRSRQGATRRYRDLLLGLLGVAAVE